MQTFVPEVSFAASAQSLDMRRLGKQRVEGLQILNVLLDRPTASGRSYKGWVNHPAVKMWQGCEAGLASYVLAVCKEWTGRGYKDTVADKVAALIVPSDELPSWWGNDAIHLSHKSNLIRKLPEFYLPLWPDVRDDLPYIWPSA